MVVQIPPARFRPRPTPPLRLAQPEERFVNPYDCLPCAELAQRHSAHLEIKGRDDKLPVVDGHYADRWTDRHAPLIQSDSLDRDISSSR